MSGIALGLELLQVAEQLAGAYSRMRALAAQNGVTDAQLSEADARFARRVADPLASQPPHLPIEAPPASDPTLARFYALSDARPYTTSQYPLVIQYADTGKFGLWPQLMLPGNATQVFP